jgi:hypothetical protein
LLLLRLVLSLNLQRRDLTAGQRAIAAAKTWGLDGYSKGGRPAKGKASETPTVREIAKQFHVTDKPIMQARDLLAEAPDLAEQVASRGNSLAAAHEQLMVRRAEAQQLYCIS